MLSFAPPRVAEPASPEVFSVEEFGSVSIPLPLLMMGGVFDFDRTSIRGGYFEVRFRGGEVAVQAGHFIGLISVNERVVLNVRPRVPITKIWHILQVADQLPVAFPALSRRYGPSDRPLGGLVEVFAEALLASIRPLRQDGLYRRYELRQTDTSFPRGRFLIGDTMRRHVARGRPDRVAVSYFEHSLDTGPNQLIKTAIWRLQALLADVLPRRRLLRLQAPLLEAYRLFERVSLDPSPRCLDDPEVRNPARLPYTRRYYADAIYIARAIVENRTVDLDSEGLELVLPSLLIDLQTAFETYLRNTLSRRLRPDGLVALNGKYEGRRSLFDIGSDRPAEPDIVVADSSVLPRARVVGEVKYMNHGVGRDEINQAIAYAASYRAPVVLIRPRLPDDAVPRASLLGQVDRLVIHEYLFDLAGDLDQEEVALASFVKSVRDSAVPPDPNQALTLWPPRPGL